MDMVVGALAACLRRGQEQSATTCCACRDAEVVNAL